VTRRKNAGRAAAIVRWDLFIDESGDFSDPEDEVVVAGLLVRDDAAGASSVQLRASLQAAAPELPWPLKASYLNRPVLFALAQACRPDAAHSRSADDAEAIVRHLNTVAAGDVAVVLDDLRAGHRLPYERVAKLDTLAQQVPQYQAVRRLAGESTAQIGRLLHALAGQSGESPLVLVAACGETVRGDVSATAPGADLATRRYLDMLHGVIIRAADILGRGEGRQQLHLHVLERPVREEILGRVTATMLHLRHVGPLARAVEGLYAGPGAPVSIKLDQICAYDARLHPTLVLADFLANRGRRALRHPSGHLTAVEDALRAEVPCSVRSCEPPASHLAAAGWAQDGIERTRRGETDTLGSPPSGSRAWAVEQAAEWCEVIQR
jgi:hypothetical protein